MFTAARNLSKGMLLAAVVLFASAQVFAQDPIKVGPDVYKTIYENDRIRVNEINFAKGAKIGMHSHPDHVVYWVEGGTLRIFNPDSTSVEVTGKAGEVLWLPACTHAGENIGETAIKLVQVELKEPAPMKQPADTTKK